MTLILIFPAHIPSFFVSHHVRIFYLFSLARSTSARRRAPFPLAVPTPHATPHRSQCGRISTLVIGTRVPHAAPWANCRADYRDKERSATTQLNEHQFSLINAAIFQQTSWNWLIGFMTKWMAAAWSAEFSGWGGNLFLYFWSCNPSYAPFVPNNQNIPIGRDSANPTFYPYRHQ